MSYLKKDDKVRIKQMSIKEFAELQEDHYGIDDENGYHKSEMVAALLNGDTLIVDDIDMYGNVTLSSTTNDYFLFTFNPECLELINKESENMSDFNLEEFSIPFDDQKDMLTYDKIGIARDLQAENEAPKTRAETLRNIIAIAQEELNNIEAKDNQNKVARNLVLDQWC